MSHSINTPAISVFPDQSATLFSNRNKRSVAKCAVYFGVYILQYFSVVFVTLNFIWTFDDLEHGTKKQLKLELRPWGCMPPLRRPFQTFVWNFVIFSIWTFEWWPKASFVRSQWPKANLLVYPWVQVCAEFEKIPSRCSWDKAFMKMERMAGRMSNTKTHCCHWCRGITWNNTQNHMWGKTKSTYFAAEGISKWSTSFFPLQCRVRK